MAIAFHVQLATTCSEGGAFLLSAKSIKIAFPTISTTIAWAARANIIRAEVDACPSTLSAGQSISKEEIAFPATLVISSIQGIAYNWASNHIALNTTSRWIVLDAPKGTILRQESAPSSAHSAITSIPPLESVSIVCKDTVFPVKAAHANLSKHLHPTVWRPIRLVIVWIALIDFFLRIQIVWQCLHSARSMSLSEENACSVPPLLLSCKMGAVSEQICLQGVKEQAPLVFAPSAFPNMC
jgi:hypothetical protein